MAIPKGITANFQTLLKAAKNGDLALIETTERGSGVTRYVLCGMAWDGREYAVTPFGHVCDETMGNPYEFYADPTTED